MKKILSKVLYLALAIPIFANATSCPTVGNNLIEDAPLFQWTDKGDHFVGTLIMDEVTITLNNGETLTTRAYAQKGQTPTVPGPTIVMEPGQKYILRFENLLPYEPLSDLHNGFKDPNVTNLHTHGVHTTGDTPGDDAVRIFQGGQGGDYVYDIHSDHMGGTFWIHAHHHGSTYLQISSGAFAFMMIDDVHDPMPVNVRNMEERHLTMAYLDPSVAGTGGDMLVSGTLNAGWNVNGKVEGDLCMPANTWQHWRMLVAAADVKAKDVTIGANCEVALLARDGVWRTTVPKDLANNTVTLTGGSRADVAVRCSDDSTLTIGNVVVANIYADAGMSPPNADPAHPYAVGGEANATTWESDRPTYLRDLRNELVVNTERVSMGARTINGSKFDLATPTFVTEANGVQEWEVSGATNHPFHLHVFHFQAQTDCGDYEAGEYYDTIASACNVRFDLNPATSTVYEGKTIFHCHLLDHEDQGAMGYMVVHDGNGYPSADPAASGIIPAPTFPAGEGYSALYDLGDPPVDPPVDPPTAETSVTVSTANAGKGQKYGVADIVVVDGNGAPVDGVEVIGDFRGDITETVTGTTNVDGQVSVITSTSTKIRSLDFCVTEIGGSPVAEICGSL